MYYGFKFYEVIRTYLQETERIDTSWTIHGDWSRM